MKRENILSKGYGKKFQRGQLFTRSFVFSRTNHELTCYMETQKRALIRPKRLSWCLPWTGAAVIPNGIKALQTSELGWAGGIPLYAFH